MKKGSTQTEEVKRKISEAMKNAFKLGLIKSGGLGKKQSEETRKKKSRKLKGRISPMKGKHHSEELKKRYKEIKGSAHPNWKGTRVAYSAFHRRITKEKGSPCYCEICGITDKSKRYEWANLTGKYHDFFDYKRMCKKCHCNYDWDRKRGNHVN